MIIIVTNGIYILITFVISIFKDMKERLLEFLKRENKSSAQLAEEIGVQPSGISHILSGRNNPSLDFVLKMLEKYTFISTDWFLFGKGTMYKDQNMQTLFDDDLDINSNTDAKSMEFGTSRPEPGPQDTVKNQSDSGVTGFTEEKVSSIARIVWFYDNNSFEEYFPRR